MINFVAGRWLGLAAAAALVAGCAGVAPPQAGDDLSSTPWAGQSRVSEPGSTHAQFWQHYRFPGKAPTQFSYARKDGRDAIAVQAVSSASMLRNKVRIEPAELGRVHFSWQVPELIAQADMATRDADDAPVRIVLAFDGDRSRLSPKDAMLSELARALTGEDMPYATLMYVWCNTREPGSVIKSPRTERIRKLVVESGATNLGQWLDYERDIRADYERVFGEPPGALIGIGLMTDSDNTKSSVKAWYGPVQMAPLALTSR